MHRLTALRFDNSYARLHPAFFEVIDATPLPDPYLVAFNPAAARLLDLDPAVAADPELAQYLCGNRRLPGAEPLAQAYAGHQFGVWVPQLGDGRALLLGEVSNARGESWDLHLKGAGPTRFSRHGDGRSVLRSAIREYLGSEALHGLGIPTTRALAIVGSALPVQRERLETAATLLRVSASHVRFGSFEYFAARGDTARLGELLGYVIGRHFPEAREAAEPALWLFSEICRRTATLIAHWMAAGFAHGVMNTDNMSVLGLTLDYGPYGFLDDYAAGFVCNHSDTGGRYAFDQQPAVGMWNCARLGDALLALGGEPDAWQSTLESYWAVYADTYLALMRGKLGLNCKSTDDVDENGLIRDLLVVLQRERMDYTRFFRELPARRGPDPWFERYAERMRAEGGDATSRAERMRKVNPKYVLRNWIAQEAIESAQRGEFSLIEQLRGLFADPYAEHPGMERFAEPPTAAARELAVSCSS